MIRRALSISVIVLAFGTSCSSEQTESSTSAPPQTAPATTSTTALPPAPPGWVAQAQPSWDRLNARLAEIEPMLHGYTWEQAKTDIRATARDLLDLASDIAAAGPAPETVKREIGELGKALLAFGQQLRAASDCDRSQSCINSRQFVRDQIQKLRLAWADATTASS